MTIRRREMHSGLLGASTAVLIAVCWWLAPTGLTNRIALPAIDFIASLWPAPATDAVTVVDIDSESLAAMGGNRIARGRFSQLIATVNGFGPKAIGVDFVLGTPCAAVLPDVASLASNLARAPVSMGFLLSDGSGVTPPESGSMVFERDLRLPDLWISQGAETSCPAYLGVASGNAVISLAGDIDAKIRSAPLVVGIDNRGYPSLALDTLRLSQDSATVFLLGDPPEVRLGDLTARMDDSASIRLRFSSDQQRRLRTISAVQVLNGTVDASRIADKVVFVGSSAAELGGLRPVPGHPLYPSVQIHADAATNLLLGTNPHIPDWAGPAALVLAIGFGIVLALFAAAMKPVVVMAATFSLAFLWIGMCALLYHRLNLIIDPVAPVFAAIAGALSSSGFQYSAVRQAEQRIRSRFEQRLPPALVSQLVNNPEILKLKGARRVATTLISDIEGFSSFAERMSPDQLIDVLDRYFEGLTNIVISHGGMVDRTTGDGIHALFNAPMDLEDHTHSALRCAVEILRFSEQLRHNPLVAPHGLGRTRIGIETGEVILGDVGGSGRMDYAAFGSSINVAARLQDANKRFDTSILIGEKARSLLEGEDLVDLGQTELRGIGMVRVFTVSDLTIGRTGG